MKVALADNCPELVPQLRSADVVVERLCEPDELAERGYELLARVFKPEVLDTKESFQGRLGPAAKLERDYLPCYAIAYADCESTRLVLGLITADIMWIEARPGDAFLAIGYVATSPLVKQAEIRGVGTYLVDKAIAIAKEEVSRDSRRLLCVAAEAEPASLGFWQKQGFLWPVGCRYLQPPLEFLENGEPRFKEVPETLLLAPIDMATESIQSEVVRDIILTIYENWCLQCWRDELSEGAMQRAEEYVLGHVFGQVARTLPATAMMLSKDFLLDAK